MSYLIFYNSGMKNNETNPAVLLENLAKVHTTPMGVQRIRNNLSLDNSISDVIDFCKKQIASPNCSIHRQGKNWYCEKDGMCITVNAYSYTIITAHPHPVVECPQSGCIETTLTKRPPFSQIKTYEEFSRHYWYREELQSICKSLNIDSSGMKDELNNNIEQYFKGNIIAQKKLFTQLHALHQKMVTHSYH